MEQRTDRAMINEVEEAGLHVSGIEREYSLFYQKQEYQSVNSILITISPHWRILEKKESIWCVTILCRCLTGQEQNLQG